MRQRAMGSTANIPAPQSSHRRPPTLQRNEGQPDCQRGINQRDRRRKIKVHYYWQCQFSFLSLTFY